MSYAIETNLWKRMRHTPLRDLVRGRLTGRLDIQGRIEAARLPEPVSKLILRLVKRTRLWRIERIDVANELIAHFADAIESGATAEQAIQAFGDERQAAMLFRRSVKRNRPLIWHIGRAMLWTMAALLIFYAIQATLMVIGRPTLSVNYIAQLNQDVEQFSDDQRGWLIYRKALIELGLTVRPKPGENSIFDLLTLDNRPGGQNWNELAQWINDNAASIDVIRHGATKPALGFLYGRTGSVNDPELGQQFSPGSGISSLGPDPMIEVLLPHIGRLQNLGMILLADARAARLAGDGARFIKDVAALQGMANQMTRHDFLVSDLFAISIRRMGTTAIDEAMTGNAAMFSDAQLRELAHLLSGPQRASDLLGLKAERRCFYDLVQRSYTDDGQGDGRMTLQGMQVMQSVSSPKPKGSFLSEAGIVVGLATPVLGASRKDIVQIYDHFMATAETNVQKPLRDANWDEYAKKFSDMRDGLVPSTRYTLLLLLVPSLSRAQATAEGWLGQRDALLAGIALEAHRRSTGEYPQTLEALTPTLLPQVPVDPVTGKPMQYRLVDGKPLIYSVGNDRDDDGGMPPNAPNPQYPQAWSTSSRNPDGDWVFYPLPVEPKQEQR